MSRALVTALAAGLLAGCVTPVKDQMARLGAAPVCCGSEREFNYAPLVLAEEKSVKLDDKSPVYNFATGRSYFAAFRLPEWRGPLQISISAGSAAGTAGGTFSPSALLLDADFKLRREFNTGERASDQRRPNNLYLFLNEANQEERYLVVFTARTNDSAGFSAVNATPTSFMLGSAYITVGASESRVSIPYAAMGSFDIKVVPYKPAAAGVPVAPPQ